MKGLLFAVVLLSLSVGCAAIDKSPIVKKIGAKNECADICVLKPRIGFGPFNDPVWEIFASVDGARFNSIGKLFRGDWGAFRVCGRVVSLRSRALLMPGAEKGPTVRSTDDEVTVPLAADAVIYIEFGGSWKTIDRLAGEALRREIESKLGPPSSTGWEWKDRRELYYSKGCQEKSERCP